MNRTIHFCSIPGVMLCVLAATAHAESSNKWRLQFSGSAWSDGVIELKISPVDDEPLTCSVSIPRGTGENAVAKMVVKACREQLPKKMVHVERDDGEDVLFKKRRGTPNFGIEIVANTVKNVRINPDKE